MEVNNYLCEKSFVELPGWFKQMETFFRPVLDNELNELRSTLQSQLQRQMSAESQVRNEGIELAIQRYGLRPTLDTNKAEGTPSTSRSCEPETKKLRPESDDVLVSAICSAIAEKGLASMSTQ